MIFFKNKDFFIGYSQTTTRACKGLEFIHIILFYDKFITFFYNKIIPKKKWIHALHFLQLISKHSGNHLFREFFQWISMITAEFRPNDILAEKFEYTILLKDDLEGNEYVYGFCLLPT